MFISLIGPKIDKSDLEPQGKLRLPMLDWEKFKRCLIMKEVRLHLQEGL